MKLNLNILHYFEILTLKAIIITIADDTFCNKVFHFGHFGYKKTEQNQTELIKKNLLVVITF